MVCEQKVREDIWEDDTGYDYIAYYAKQMLTPWHCDRKRVISDDFVKLAEFSVHVSDAQPQSPYHIIDC